MKSHLNQNEIIVAFDTSCDETSVAVLNGRRVLSSIVSSQVNLHQKWGGVVPGIARKAHEKNIGPAYKEALKKAKINEDQLNYIAVTYGPGLAIALEVGLNFAKNLAKRLKVGIFPVNHIEGHLLSSFALNSRGNGKLKKINKEKLFPSLGIIVTGSQTDLIIVNDFKDYKLIGETLDDAAGEAFDKVARMLNLGYPGGPILTALAKQSLKSNYKKGNNNFKILEERHKFFDLPIPMKKSNSFNFSFSGLKTACLYKIQEINKTRNLKDISWVNEFSSGFIYAICKSIEIKVKKALKTFPEIKTIIVGGGVINNEFLVRNLLSIAKQNKIQIFFPEIKYRSDNAAMIGISAYFDIQLGKKPVYGKKIDKIDRIPMITI